MNEIKLSQKLKTALDAAPVSSRAATRLAVARAEAVARAAELAGAGQTLQQGNRLVRFWHLHTQMCSLGAILLVLMLAGSAWQWQQHRAAERALDAELLSDELPMDYLLSGEVKPWGDKAHT